MSKNVSATRQGVFLRKIICLPSLVGHPAFFGNVDSAGVKAPIPASADSTEVSLGKSASADSAGLRV
jgi:hypothetical protein